MVRKNGVLTGEKKFLAHFFFAKKYLPNHYFFQKKSLPNQSFSRKKYLSHHLELEENNSLGIKHMYYQCEETIELEYPQYEDSRTPVCFAWTVAETMVISPNDVLPQEQVLLTIVSDSRDGLLAQLNTAMSLSITELVELHTRAWAELWDSGRLEVTGEAELERVVLASQYYLLSSLPSPESETEFCGLSPGSLAYGDLGQDYQVASHFLNAHLKNHFSNHFF